MTLPLDSVASLMGLAALVVVTMSAVLDFVRCWSGIAGALLFGLLAGLSGMTLVELLQGRLPVFWAREPVWLLLCLGSAALTRRLAPYYPAWTRWLPWLDALSLALLSVLGAALALQLGAAAAVAVCCGILAALAAPLLRDLLLARAVRIIHQPNYIAGASAGALCCVALTLADLPQAPVLLLSSLLALCLRGAAMRGSSVAG